MVQRSGHFKTAHTGWYLSAKAYGEACDELGRVVRRFETALYGALLRGQSKKRYLHARFPGFRYEQPPGISKWTGALPFQRAKVLQTFKHKADYP
jgi:hypothetical protein